MERLIELFINTEDGEFFDRGGMLAAYNPAISAGELVRCDVQLCAGVPAFNASGELLNPDTSFAGTLAAGEIIVDNNFNWYDEGTLLEALTSGTEISALSVSSEAAPRPIGSVMLDSDTVVNFCGWEKTEGGYRLTLADAEFNPAPFTPSAAFDVGAAIRIIEQPIIVSAQNDDTGRDTGRFSGLLDAANPVYESLIEGNESIPSCRLEFSIYLDGRAVFRARHLFDCDGAMAMTKGVAYLRSDSWREADSRYIKLTDWKAAPEYQFSEDAADWHDDQTDADLYYRERRSGGEWGEAIKLKAGPKGDPGESGTGGLNPEPFLEFKDAGSLLLKSGTALSVGDVEYSATADIELDVADLLDTGTIQSGKDYCVYLTTDKQFVVSLNSTFPSGTLSDGSTAFSAENTRKIGGFHTLCADAGEIDEHPLSGFSAGDILPASVWCLNHRPFSEPAGMVYCDALDFWVDIYLQSGTGEATASVFGGTITDTRSLQNHAEDMFLVNKRLLSNDEFSAAAEGANQRASISTADDPVTTGGHTASDGRRMISDIGCEDTCGALWQWLRDIGPAGGNGWTSDPGTKGDIQGSLFGLLAGGSWGASTNYGSRSRNATNQVSITNNSISARGMSQNITSTEG